MRARASIAAALAALCGCAGAGVAPATAAPGPWVDPGKIVISPDGRDLYATGSRTLSFRRDLLTGELTQTDELGPPGGAIAITPDGRHVYVGYRLQGVVGAAIHILSRDPATGLITHESTFVEDAASHIAPGQITDLAVSPDGRFLYATQESENAVVVLAIDPASGELRLEQALYGGPGGEPGLDHPPHELSLAPAGDTVYLAADAVLSFARDPATGHLSQLPAPIGDTHSQAWHVAASPDGKRVYAGIFAFTAYDRDPASGRLTEVGPAKGDDTGCAPCDAGPLAISPDSGSILQMESRDDKLLQFDATPDGARLTGVYAGLQGASDGDGVAWSPDGQFAYVAGGERLTPGFTSNTSVGGSIAVLRREGSGLASVAALTPTPPAPDWAAATGVSINGGAIYTNDPHVSLTVTVPGWTPASFRVSNEPSFGGVHATRVTAQSAKYDWLLDTTSGPVRSVKHVWIRFTGNGLYPDTVVSDDVILDQVPPQIVSATLRRAGKRSRITLRAKDNRSGVRRLQVTKDRRKPGKARKFAASVVVAGAPRVLYLRVGDGAGNLSRWRTVRR